MYSIPPFSTGLLPYPVSKVVVHIVFSTMHQEPLLVGEIRSAALAKLDAIAKHNDCPPLIIGGGEDHVHILCRMATTVTQHELLHELKEESARWIRDQFADQQSFGWQESDGMFSVSECDIPAMIAYIEKQAQYHSFLSFKDEFRMILIENGCEWNEQELWE